MRGPDGGGLGLRREEGNFDGVRTMSDDASRPCLERHTRSMGVPEWAWKTKTCETARERAELGLGPRGWPESIISPGRGLSGTRRFRIPHPAHKGYDGAMAS